MSFPPPPPGGGGPFNGPPPSPIDPVSSIDEMKYVSIAVFSVLLWDIMTTLDQEVKYLSNAKISTVKVLWILNRILVPVNVGVHILVSFVPTSMNLCTIAGKFIEWMSVVNLFVVQAALSKRIIAIYHQSRFVFAFVLILLLGSTASRIVIIALNPTPYGAMTFGNLNSVCLAFPSPIGAAAFYGPLIFDTILFVMTVARMHTQLSRGEPMRGGLLIRLYRDGSIYFLVVAVTMGITIIGFFFMPLLGPFTESFLFLGIVSIACSHMILSLRGVAQPTYDTSAIGLQNWQNSPRIEMTVTVTTQSKTSV